MSDRTDAPIVIETGPDPIGAVIWLHGLGADGHDFEPIVAELELPAGVGLRFVFPHAPYRPVTLNGGQVMRAWYDIGMGAGGLWQDAAQIRESEGLVAGLIAREVARGIPTRRIVLAGFSQGGVVAAHAGLHHPEPLAGLLILSAPLVGCARLLAEVHAANVATPIFLAHGLDDPLVPSAAARGAERLMRERGLAVSWHEYPMPHSVCPQEIRDMRTWLLATVGGAPVAGPKPPSSA